MPKFYKLLLCTLFWVTSLLVQWDCNRCILIKVQVKSSKHHHPTNQSLSGTITQIQSRARALSPKGMARSVCWCHSQQRCFTWLGTRKYAILQTTHMVSRLNQIHMCVGMFQQAQGLCTLNKVEANFTTYNKVVKISTSLIHKWKQLENDSCKKTYHRCKCSRHSCELTRRCGVTGLRQAKARPDLENISRDYSTRHDNKHDDERNDAASLRALVLFAVDCTRERAHSQHSAH